MRKSKKLVLVQLPVPQLNQYRKTLNIPLAPAWIASALRDVEGVETEIISQEYATYLSDATLIDLILSKAPDILGLSLYLWNTDRSLYIAEEVKKRSNAKIIVGGPEVTLDNDYIKRPWIDTMFIGEGEGAIRDFFSGNVRSDSKIIFSNNSWDFSSAVSPYITGMLSPTIENVMLLETQRGCPYNCTYCFYSKAIRGVKYSGESFVRMAVNWALINKIKEIYIMDPSFDTHPDFVKLLNMVKAINRDKLFTLTTEMRVEGLTDEKVDLMKEANFNMVEIGLQSSSTDVLKEINRKLDLDLFLRGVNLLKKRGIETRIDLILGLPNDNPESFRGTLEFIIEHGLYYDAELFLLSVLPGTKLREQASNLGIEYMKHPPYHVLETKTYKPYQLISSWNDAEEILDCNFTPPPFLDIGYKVNGLLTTTINEGTFIKKLIVSNRNTEFNLLEIGRKLFHPYQIILLPGFADMSLLTKIVMELTLLNPFTPFELIIFEPPDEWDIVDIFSSAKMFKPHYLDMEYRFKLKENERGCVVITVVTKKKKRRWEGYLVRQVFWWQEDRLPTLKEMKALEHLDGILLDGSFDTDQMRKWMSRYHKIADELPSISFADEQTQRKWIHMCYPEDFLEDCIF